MAKLHIVEFTRQGLDPRAVVPPAEEPAVATQAVTFTTATQSAVFSQATRLILIKADAKAHILIGDNPTAGANDYYLNANEYEYRAVNPGDRISAYDGIS